MEFEMSDNVENVTGQARERVHIIACGVLGVDLRAIMPTIPGKDFVLDLLPGKLHQTPAELHRRVQERIDAVSSARSADRIAIAYGICGRGTIGIQARDIPIDIPRVHDCIALFLGSDAAYREQFGKYPGTYYITAGWVDEDMGVKGKACSAGSGLDPDLVAAHGEENARAVDEFLGSWKHNYQRAAFIDTGVGNRNLCSLAQDLAKENGWLYEELKGSHDILHALLLGEPHPGVLRVGPGMVTVFDAIERRLTARPPSTMALAATATKSDTGDSFISLPSASGTRRPGNGLGIDAGGTYTDTAVFDWTTERVTAKAKAPTSHWDYSVGISQSLDALPPESLRDISLVAVSTTLATNAIVEGKGQKVGLLLMPPPGGFDSSKFDHRPLRVVKGSLAIDGSELAPIDIEEVRRTAIEMVNTDHVRAFAVTGYASHVNPAHELAVAEIVRQATGLSVTCGHEISSACGYTVRAATATLNARIIPCLRDLLERLRAVLSSKGIDAPVMVVRSDGALMGVEFALEHPVETLLSGPAASVAGVRRLTNAKDAIVLDMGGTTSDTAVLRDGAVKTDPDGASVGRWRTHVRALAVRTLGLGGDSDISVDPGSASIQIGPQRVLPICRLAQFCGEGAEAHALDALDRADSDSRDREMSALYAIAPTAAHRDESSLTERQRIVLDALASGPKTVAELLAATKCMRPSFLELSPLVDRMLIQRIGFTPTDALHVLGRMAMWDSEAARRTATRLGVRLGLDANAFAERVIHDVALKASRELMLTRLDALAATASERRAAREASASDWLGQSLLARGLGEIADGLGVRLELGVPVIGIGAPSSFFVPEVARLLNTEAILPEDGDVANAIGAITSEVQVVRQVTIQPDEIGVLHVQGLAGAPTFDKIEKAEAYCRVELEKLVRALAEQSGAHDATVTIKSNDRVTISADGTGLFLGRRIEAVASGRPRT